MDRLRVRGEVMRGATVALVSFWGLIVAAVVEHISFASTAVNCLMVFLALSSCLCLFIALSLRVNYRPMAILLRVVLSGMYLLTLWVLGMAWAFDPWGKPDVEVRHGSSVCRAVYGDTTEVRVFAMYALGLERLKTSYSVDAASPETSCSHF